MVENFNNDDNADDDDVEQISFSSSSYHHHQYRDFDFPYKSHSQHMAIILSCLITFLISLFAISLTLLWMLNNNININQSTTITTTLNNEPEILITSSSSSTSMLILKDNLVKNFNKNGHIIRINLYDNDIIVDNQHFDGKIPNSNNRHNKLQRNSTSLYSEQNLNEILIEKFPINHLMNLNNFQFIKKNSNRCQNLSQLSSTESNSFLNLVIIIHSAVQNFHHRQIIRETWGKIQPIDFNDHNHRQQKANIIYVFILGATNSSQLQNHLNEEFENYHDLVQSNFIDHYQNLTYKHVASLRWAIEYCYHVDFIIKIDDDAYLNLYTVIESLINYKNHLITDQNILRAKNLLACSVFPSNTKPKRHGKWSLSLESYPDKTFPSYCSGVGYVITPDLAFDLFEAAQNAHTFIPYISIDDVYITGLLMEILQPSIQPVPLNSLYVYNVQKLRNWLRNSDDIVCPNPYWIGDIGNESNREQLIRKLWQKTKIAWQNYQQNRCN